MLHSGGAMTEFFLMLVAIAILEIIFVRSAFSLDFSFAQLLLLGVIFLAGVGFSFGSMYIFSIQWVNKEDDNFGTFMYFSLTVAMYVLTAILSLVPLFYNYLMRHSDQVMSLEENQRSEFLATNSSWILLRLGTYFFMVASGLSGVIFSHLLIPTSGQPSVGLRLGIACAFIIPLISGILVGVKVLNKLNLVAYKWKLSSDSPQTK